MSLPQAPSRPAAARRAIGVACAVALLAVPAALEAQQREAESARTEAEAARLVKGYAVAYAAADAELTEARAEVRVVRSEAREARARSDAAEAAAGLLMAQIQELGGNPGTSPESGAPAHVAERAERESAQDRGPSD